MSEQDVPQIYLVTPKSPGEDFFGNLARVLEEFSVACVRIDIASTDEMEIIQFCDKARETCHEYDVPVTVTDHIGLVGRLGLDGVHLTDGARSIRSVRKDLGADAIVGAFCGSSKHDGMNAAESGADYVSFGPLVASSLGSGEFAEHDLFSWWSEMIEVPIVAEGIVNQEAAKQISSVTDFISLRDEIWASDDPVAAFKSYQAAIT